MIYVGIALGLLLVGYVFPHWATVALVGVIAIPVLLLAEDSPEDGIPAVFGLVALPLPLMLVTVGGIARLWPRRERAGRRA